MCEVHAGSWQLRAGSFASEKKYIHYDESSRPAASVRVDRQRPCARNVVANFAHGIDVGGCPADDAGAHAVWSREEVARGDPGGKGLLAGRVDLRRLRLHLRTGNPASLRGATIPVEVPAVRWAPPPLREKGWGYDRPN